MNETYIQKLIRLVEESDIESLEVHSWGRKVRINKRLDPSSNGHGKNGAAVHTVTASAPPATPSAPPSPAPQPQAETPAAPAQESADDSRYVPIKSPMVGTFYSAPAPDADPYVSVNQQVRAGQVVCIVEAMKLMNEIESEASGRIVKVLVQNAEPVEFGQTLFLIDPD